MKCPNCDLETDEDVCPECGTQILNATEDMLESLVVKASLPDLAALVRTGQASGLITAVTAYA